MLKQKHLHLPHLLAVKVLIILITIDQWTNSITFAVRVEGVYLYSGFYVFGYSQHITVEATAPQYHIVRPNQEGRGEGGLLPGLSLMLTVGRSWGSLCCRSGSPH